MTPEQNKQEFLEALSQLTLKHKLVIVGCGCCDSPEVIELVDTDFYGNGRLQFHKDTQRYTG